MGSNGPPRSTKPERYLGQWPGQTPRSAVGIDRVGSGPPTDCPRTRWLLTGSRRHRTPAGRRLSDTESACSSCSAGRGTSGLDLTTLRGGYPGGASRIPLSTEDVGLLPLSGPVDRRCLNSATWARRTEHQGRVDSCARLPESTSRLAIRVSCQSERTSGEASGLHSFFGDRYPILG